MPALGPAFVTPHAVRQYQRRVAPLPYDAARAAILDGLARSWHRARPCPSGAIEIRVRGVGAFRARLRPGDGALPAVVTILASRP